MTIATIGRLMKKLDIGFDSSVVRLFRISWL
jgi:hypothetical protein